MTSNCRHDRGAEQVWLRRFATELAGEEARRLCDELMAEEAMALIRHDLIAA
jgi:hypothetical protein